MSIGHFGRFPKVLVFLAKLQLNSCTMWPWKWVRESKQDLLSLWFYNADQCRPVAGTSCLVQPEPKPQALFLKHCRTESPDFHPLQSQKCLLGIVQLCKVCKVAEVDGKNCVTMSSILCLVVPYLLKKSVSFITLKNRMTNTIQLKINFDHVTHL